MRMRYVLAGFAALLLAAAAAGAALAAGGFTGVTLHACLNGGKLNNVQVTGQPGCSSLATPVNWAGQASLSPSPSPTSPSPSPTSPSPSPTGTPCVTSAAMGSCAYGTSTYVNQDVWNPISGWSQTLTSYAPGNWSAVADMPAGNLAVVSYPDVQQLYSSPNLSSFSSLTSTFAETMNATAGTHAEAAYDLWLNNWGNEVMIWVDNAGQGFGSDTNLGTTVIGGQSWTVYRNGGPGGELIVSLNSNEQTGTVDILATLQYLQAQGWLPASSTLTGADFGFEVSSTGGQPETFTVSGYGITGG